MSSRIPGWICGLKKPGMIALEVVPAAISGKRLGTAM